MRTSKPLWHEGVILSPQHFQQSDRWLDAERRQFASLAVASPWGVIDAAVDKTALDVERLQMTRLSLRFRDGTPIDTSTADVLPEARDLAVDVPSDRHEVIVSVGLPLLNAQGGNCRLDDALPSRPKRFFREYVQVADLHGMEDAELAVERHALHLLFDFESHADYVVCPVARLVRGKGGLFVLDDEWVPPCFALIGHAKHIARVERIADILLAKSIVLSDRRSERIEQVAEYGVSDVSLFWLLHCLNTHWPDLRFLLDHPYQPPERLYQVLARLAGALSTFSTERTLAAIPSYQHACQDDVFSQLESLIRELLDAVIPSRVVPLGLVKQSATGWSGQILDERLLAGADFYLSVSAAMSVADLTEQIPRLCKVGAPDDIAHIVNSALSGVPIRPVQRVPSAIPVRLENQYFALDACDGALARMLTARACQIYLPTSVPEASLEIYAVITSFAER